MAGNRAVFKTAMQKGHNHAWDREWLKAIQQYKLAVDEFPEDAAARNSLAFAYLKAKRLRESLREYRKVSDLRPNDPSPLCEMAMILEELGRARDASGAWKAVAQRQVQQRAFGKAIEAWQEVLRLEPLDKEAHERLAEAYASKSDPIEAANQYLSLARLHQRDGDSAQAVKYGGLAVSLDGRSREARAFLESLTSGTGSTGWEPSLLIQSEGLGPTDNALQEALAILAEAILGEERLIDDAANVLQPEVTGESVPVGQSEVRTTLARAIDYHSRGMAEEALECYEKALNVGVRWPEVIYSVGLLYKETLRFGEALGLLEACVERPEYRLASHLALGECHWAQGQGGQALNHFLKALEAIDLDMVGADRSDQVRQSYQDLLDGHELLANEGTAQAFVRSLTDLLRGSNWKRKVMNTRQKLDSLAGDGVVLILPEFLEMPRWGQVLDFMDSSQDYLRRGMPFIALEECYRAIAVAPAYLPLHLRLAEIFAAQGKVEEAVGKYAAVADAYLIRDKPRRATEVYVRASAVAPMNTVIREKLIDLLIARNEIKQALEQYLALGESYYRLARVDEALEKYERALSVARRASETGWEVRIRHHMADLYMQRVQWDRAMAAYERIRQLAPNDEVASLRLVDLQYKLGRRDVALKELDGLIVRFGKAGRLEQVIDALKDLIDSNPQDMHLRSRLGMIYLEAGMNEEAIAELDALGELQLEAGLKDEAVNTLRRIISLRPPEVDGYTQLLRKLDGDSA